MAKRYRKPIPKSQREIADGLVNSYDAKRGNPNDAREGAQYPPTNEANVDFNRSTKMSFKDDTVKPYTVSIKDIDESIMYYFNEVIRPYVIQNGERIAVPIIYGSPERWKSVQKDGYYRDKKGAIMNPIIMFKRNSVEKNRALTNKLDANNPNIYTSWQKSYSKKNFYSNFNLLNNSIPTKQFIANVVPDYVTLTYDCIVQTYYVEQLNKIVEAINYASDSYWGNPSRFKFRARIDSFNIATQLEQGKDRTVRSDFSIKMFGYIIPDVVQKETTAVKKYNAKSKIIFSLETDSNPARYEANPQVTDDRRSRATQGGNVNLSTPPTTFTTQIEAPALISLNDLPTTDPLVAGVLWNNGGVPTVSSGWYL